MVGRSKLVDAFFESSKLRNFLNALMHGWVKSTAEAFEITIQPKGGAATYKSPKNRAVFWRA